MDLDLSDEMTDNHESVNQINHSFFTGMDDEQPSTSRHNRGQNVEVEPTEVMPRKLTADEHSRNIICQAELSKAKMYPPTGRSQTFEFIAKMDQDYFIVGSHLSQVVQSKII